MCIVLSVAVYVCLAPCQFGFLRLTPNRFCNVYPNVALIIGARYDGSGGFKKPGERLAYYVAHEVSDMELFKRVRVGVLHHYFFAGVELRDFLVFWSQRLARKEEVYEFAHYLNFLYFITTE